MADFPKVRPLFDRVANRAAHGEFTTDDIERLVMEGRLTVGAVMENGKPVLAVAFEFIYYPRMTVLNILALAGSRLNAVMEAFWPRFLGWARTTGAQSIQASCSPAMSRLLARHGFKTTYQVVRRKL